MRPASSLASSSRPQSRVSVATTRPPSQQSQRTTARAPPSRHAQHTANLVQQLVTQVLCLSPEDDRERIISTSARVSKTLEHGTKNGMTAESDAIDKRFMGLIQKARVLVQDDLADALDGSYKRLKAVVSENYTLDSQFKPTTLPDYLQFLLSLALPPTRSTHINASLVLQNLREPPEDPDVLTWKAILAEEPFEGQHWEGVYGLHAGATVENWSKTRSDTPDLTDFDSDDAIDDDSEESSFESGDESPLSAMAREGPIDSLDRTASPAPVAPSAREIVEDLKRRQYWNNEWRSDTDTTRPFDLGDPSTLSPAVTRTLGAVDSASSQFVTSSRESYINEVDAVRDVLMALQGRQSCLFEYKTGDSGRFYAIEASHNAPRLVHLTLTSYHSILASFATHATTLHRLRCFASSIFSRCSSPLHPPLDGAPPRERRCRTLEALAEAIDAQLREFDTWCAQREEAIIRARVGIGGEMIVSLLSLDMEVRGYLKETFDVVLDILRGIQIRTLSLSSSSSRTTDHSDLELDSVQIYMLHPAHLSTAILSELLSSIQNRLSTGDSPTAAALMRIFICTAEPLWSCIKRWLRDGMSVVDTAENEDAEEADSTVIEEEFFVRRNETTLGSPDFWTHGYTIRGTDEETDIDGARDQLAWTPRFLDHVIKDVLAAGKAIGLLRSLGIDDIFTDGRGDAWLADWSSFRTLLGPDGGRLEPPDVDRVDADAMFRPAYHTAPHGTTPSLPALTTDAVTLLVYDYLSHPCSIAQARLRRVLVDDCELWSHLHSMEDLYLMRRGDTLSHFCDILFARMDARQPWSDFHFLNTAFRDVVAANPYNWIDQTLVRLSFRGAKEKAVSRTVRGFDDLTVEYQVPFPLTYLFGPTSSQVYSSIFVFIIQLRRAKTVIENILIRGAMKNAPNARGVELQLFYALRSKLAWFINTSMNFFLTNVLHTQVQHFHEALKGATSLDEMISIHETHLQRIQGRCLLHPNTSALHRAVLSALDIALHFSDTVTAFMGADATHDISRRSLVILRSQRRSRRARLQRMKKKDVVGFSQVLPQESEESSDEEDGLAGESKYTGDEDTTASVNASMSFVDDSFLSRIDRMSTELDGLVRFLRRGVEGLAGSTGDAAPTFGIFAFALEDWDL